MDSRATALASLAEITGFRLQKLTAGQLTEILDTTIATKEWITQAIYESRAKDYANPYRKIVYDSAEEMNSVAGELSPNSFIKLQQQELLQFKKNIVALKKKWKLK